MDFDGFCNFCQGSCPSLSKDLCVMWWFVVRCLFFLLLVCSGLVQCSMVRYGSVRHAMVRHVCTCVDICLYGSDRKGGKTDSCSML